MKRFLLLSMCIILLITCSVGCDSSNANSGGEGSKTRADFECGKRAYNELVEAADICEKMGDVVYNAWYFSIYEADDCTSSNIVSKFASKVGLSVSEINAAAEEYLGEYASYLNTVLDDFQYSVDIVIVALEQNGTVGKLDSALSSAKAELKTMTQNYSDYSEYPSLKSFYSEVDSYATFIKSPTGSFEQLKTTIESYEKEIRTYRSDLSFVFED